MAPALHALTRAECEVLLRGQEHGRIALSTPQGPHIVPVRYVVDDGEPGFSIVTVVGAYSLIATYGDRAMLAFEVDTLDTTSGASSSVVARGRGEVLRRRRELGAPVSQGLGTAGLRSLFVRLRPLELSGRRLDPVTLDR